MIEKTQSLEIIGVHCRDLLDPQEIFDVWQPQLQDRLYSNLIDFGTKIDPISSIWRI
jgi:hypothetical protein